MSQDIKLYILFASRWSEQNSLKASTAWRRLVSFLFRVYKINSMKIINRWLNRFDYHMINNWYLPSQTKGRNALSTSSRESLKEFDMKTLEAVAIVSNSALLSNKQIYSCTEEKCIGVQERERGRERGVLYEKEREVRWERERRNTLHTYNWIMITYNSAKD